MNLEINIKNHRYPIGIKSWQAGGVNKLMNFWGNLAGRRNQPLGQFWPVTT